MLPNPPTFASVLKMANAAIPDPPTTDNPNPDDGADAPVTKPGNINTQD